MSLPAGQYYPFEIAYMDAGNEVGRFSAYGTQITNDDATGNIEEATTAFNALVTAADAITLGVRPRQRYYSEQIFTVAQPTNGANRETKLLVQFRDATTGQRFTATVPTLDPTIPEYVQNINVKDAVALDSPAAIVTFVSAFEAFVQAPTTHNAVEVVGLRVVGRNI